MRYREFRNVKLLSISEALKPSQYRDMVKGWDKQRYSDIFLNPKYKHDKNGYRVYLPIDDQPNQSQNKSDTQVQIERFLDENGFDMVDYIKGIVYNREKKQNIKIGKVLNKLKATDLLNAFNVDKSREATQASYVAVISRHPYDIAGQSTDRGWRSCMNLENGENAHYVPLDIDAGTLVAYVTRSNDLDLKNPVGRVSIKPFVDVLGKPQIYFGIEKQVYGTRVSGFVEAVRSWVDEVNRAHELDDVAVLKFHPDLYRDSDLASQRHVTGKNLSDKERENLKSLSKNLIDVLRMDNPSDSELVVAIHSNSRVFKRLMAREGFVPSNKVQIAAVTENSSNIFDLLDAGIKISDNVITAVAQRSSDTVISLQQKYPDIKIPNEAVNAAVRSDPQNLTFFDLKKLSADTIMHSLSYPRNLDILFKSIKVNRQHIVKALNTGYENAEKILEYCHKNGIDIDIKITEAIIEKRIPRMVNSLLEYNKQNPDSTVPFEQKHIRQILLYNFKDHDYRSAREFLEIFAEYDLKIENSTILEIVKQTKSSQILDLLDYVNQDISEKLAVACLEHSGNAIKHISDPDVELQKKAVSTTPSAVLDIENPDPEAVKISLSAAPYLIERIKNVEPSYFKLIAKHHMPNVRWELEEESDLFPRIGNYIGMMKENGLDDEEIQENLELAVESEPHRIIALIVQGSEFVNENVINSAAGKHDHINLIPHLVKEDIMPTVKSMQLELKNGYIKPYKIMENIKDFQDRQKEKFFNESTLKKLMAAVTNKEDQASLITHAYVNDLLSGVEADPRLIKFAIKNADAGNSLRTLYALNAYNVPLQASYLELAFSGGEYSYDDLKSFVENANIEGMEKEIIKLISENATSKSDAATKLVVSSSLVADHADEETWIEILKRWPNLIKYTSLFKAEETQAMIDTAYQSGGVWEPLDLGDMVRASNPRAKPRFKITRITDDGYEISLNGETKGTFPRERIHRVNGITPPKGYVYPKKEDKNEN